MQTVSTTEQLQNTISLVSSIFEQTTELDRFEMASIELDNLIEKGLIPKKEYNLLTTAEMGVNKVRFNVPKPTTFVNGK